MELMSAEAKKLQERCDRFIVIKDRNKLGSAVMGFDKEHDQEFRELLSRCDLIAQSPLQVVRLGGKHCLYVFSEYSPYTVINDRQDLLNIAISGNCPGRENPFVRKGNRK